MVYLITLVELKVNILAMSLSHQFSFFLKIVKTREWVTQSRSLIFHVAQMCYIKRFIRYKNTAFSLNYSTDISLRCCKVSRVLQLCSTAFLIIEISEFNRLIARLLSFKAYESCQGLDVVSYILQPHWRHTHTHTHTQAAKWLYQ